MKKTVALLLTILALTLAFVSCNLDGTTGILWDVAQSKTPLSIRYKQLLGDDGTYLYFRTADGVKRVTTAKVNTAVATSISEHIIMAASYLKAPDNKVFYITNNDDERAGNIINVVDTTNLSAPISTITITSTQATAISTELAIKNLYANSMILVSGKDGSDKKVFQLLKYVGATFGTSVATFTMTDNNYDLYAVIQQTGKEQDATAPMIVSFMNASGDREHYLVDPSGPTTTSLGTASVQIANFYYYDATNMYVLSTDGELYHVTGPTWTLIGSSSKTYGTNAFVLPVVAGTNYHLITKTTTKSSSLRVFTIVNTSLTANIGAGVDVSSGYAEELALSTIISAQLKLTPPAGTTTLLVATDKNGMYDISITNANAAVNDSTSGTTSEAEAYTF